MAIMLLLHNMEYKKILKMFAITFKLYTSYYIHQQHAYFKSLIASFVSIPYI